MVDSKTGGIILALIGALLAAINGTFANLDLRTLGAFILIVGVIVFLSKK